MEVPRPITPQRPGTSKSSSRPASRNFSRHRTRALKTEAETGWVDCSLIADFLEKSLRLLVCVDGSDSAAFGLQYVAKCLMMQDREHQLEVMHVINPSKDQQALPLQFKTDSVRALVESLLASSLPASRYTLNFGRTTVYGEKASDLLLEEANATGADFICMGLFGRKGQSRQKVMASNAFKVLSHAGATCILMQDTEERRLPIRRPTKFLISISLNAAATKAFIDALKLSKPGDEIHVVYVKSYMERTDSDYTKAIREKFSNFFAGLAGEAHETTACSEVLAQFGDRQAFFELINKKRRESTADTIARHAEDIDADFVCLGTNTLRQIHDKAHLGSVSLGVIAATDRNIIISNYTPEDHAVGGDRRL